MSTAATSQLIAAPAGFALSPEFWAQFAAMHWGQQPGLLKQPFPAPLATQAEIFQALVAAGDRFRAGNYDLPMQFFDERAFTTAGKRTCAYLPEADDQTLSGYAQRVTQMLDGQRFALVQNGNLLAHAADLWWRVRAFVQGLFAHIPQQDVFSALFLGNYESTPFGVHQDDKSNFQFVIAGRKRMHLWSDEFARATPELKGTLDYARFLDDGITLEAEPGDVMFWPSSYWHIGGSGAGLSACLTIGLRPFSSPFADAWQRLAGRIGARIRQLPRAIEPRCAPESDAAIATVAELIVRTLREANGDVELERGLTATWLKRLSSGGPVDLLPTLPPTALADEMFIHGCEEAPILWQPAAGYQALIAANGHAFSVPAAPGLPRLLERLNSGMPLRVGSLIEEYTGSARLGEVELEATPEGIRALLEKLHSLRGHCGLWLILNRAVE